MTIRDTHAHRWRMGDLFICWLYKDITALNSDYISHSDDVNSITKLFGLSAWQKSQFVDGLVHTALLLPHSMLALHASTEH